MTEILQPLAIIVLIALLIELCIDVTAKVKLNDSRIDRNNSIISLNKSKKKLLSLQIIRLERDMGVRI